MADAPDPRRRDRANGRLVLALGLLVCGMVGLSFAAVPLYQLFCQVTGLGGTTQVSQVDADRVLDRTVVVRFDANVAPDLPWRFEPEVRKMRVHVGETALAFYRVKNLSDRPITGTATFNVTPLKTGQYFVKTQCFCFTEQRLEPGQELEMGVSFHVDPELDADPNMDEVSAITLSYTFFVDPEPEQAALLPAAEEGRSRVN